MSEKAVVVMNAVPAVPAVPIGTFLGLDPVLMVIGFISALVALMHLPPKDTSRHTPLRVFALVAGSAFLAGVFAPVAVAGGMNYFPWLANVDRTGLKVAMAAVVGALPYLVPLLWGLWQEHRKGV